MVFKKQILTCLQASVNRSELYPQLIKSPTLLLLTSQLPLCVGPQERIVQTAYLEQTDLLKMGK
jgi:hypothetical protein